MAITIGELAVYAKECYRLTAAIGTSLMKELPDSMDTECVLMSDAEVYQHCVKGIYSRIGSVAGNAEFAAKYAGYCANAPYVSEAAEWLERAALELEYAVPHIVGVQTSKAREHIGNCRRIADVAKSEDRVRSVVG